MKNFAISLAIGKALLLAAFWLTAFTACQTTNDANAQTPAPAPVATATPSASTPNDKIDRPVSEAYTGELSIFENENRAANLQIERVMDVLKINKGKSVADIGAGSGWFSTRAAQRVGAEGRVFAVEINQEYINFINERAKRENLANIQTVLGTENDPKLAENSIDAALILKTYHEIGEPITVLRNLKKAMREDALLGIIDRNGTGSDHGIDLEKVVEELRRAGFEKVADYDFVKPDGMDYFVVFRKAE